MYREPLPDGCPPTDAEPPFDGMVVYRLARTKPPTDRDFKSKRALRPSGNYGAYDECSLHGLSVYRNLRSAQNLLLTDLWSDAGIYAVALDSSSGRIKNDRDDHHVFWPFASFDILGACREADSQ